MTLLPVLLGVAVTEDHCALFLCHKCDADHAQAQGTHITLEAADERARAVLRDRRRRRQRRERKGMKKAGRARSRMSEGLRVAVIRRGGEKGNMISQENGILARTYLVLFQF